VSRPLAVDLVHAGLLGVTAWLSVPVVRNLCSKHQVMNYSYNSLHLVNTYGAFGSVTRERYEIVIEGIDDEPGDPAVQWRAYEFKGKPGDPTRLPPQVAPYHLRLDWLMWFLPLSVTVTSCGIVVRAMEPWFPALLRKLHEGDARMRALLRHDPFPDRPPRYLRARFFRYEFTSLAELRETGAWWRRTWIDDYVAPIRRDDLA